MLAKRDCGIKGCEATLKASMESGIFDTLEQVHKDALVIYDGLKMLCRRFGHTFLLDRRFRRSKHFQEFPVKDWNKAYKFMEENEIIIREEKHEHSRIYLYKFWYAEDSIARNMKVLFEKHQCNPWKFDIDFERYASEKF